MLSTYHCHTTYCDGKSLPEEMVLAAIRAGCPEIGFSDHSHIPGMDWTMSKSGEAEYRREILSLREKYCDRIRIYLGLELDIRSRITDSERKEYDYIIGSVHSIYAKGKTVEVDQSAAVARSAIENIFGGDPYAYCEAYYRNEARVYDITGCDIIGHFDLVTKFIEVDPMFSEDHPRYVSARNKALEVLLKTPAVFEVNTGAISRGYRNSPYPHQDVIRRIAAAGVPTVITSDSHRAETLVTGLPEARELLDSMSCKYLTTLLDVLKITRG